VPSAVRANFWKSAITTPGAALVRREVFSSAGGWNENFNTAADRDLWCRLGTSSEFAFLDRTVVERRLHDDNMSGDKNRARRQAVEVQLAFLAWCESRGVDTTFLSTSALEILERNVQRAMAERAFEAAKWIVMEAGSRGLRSPHFQLAQRLSMMPRFAREVELKVREFFKK
jgi:hypothetical protein